MKYYKTLLSTASLLALLGETAFGQYQCPDVKCSEPIGGLICYLHPGTSPVVDTIRLFKCPADQWCYLKEGEYSWVNAYQNGVTNSLVRTLSPVYSKYSKKVCEDISTFK